jgi:hypothetical protein
VTQDPPRPPWATEPEHVQPEVVDAPGQGPAGGHGPSDGSTDGSSDGEADGEQVTRPTKLIRIASMVRSMLDEVRRAPLDEHGRRRLREIHEKSLDELEGILSDDLRSELAEVVLPFQDDTPTESELRIAQAQLVGWLEGLFHGIQATLFTQQIQAQREFEAMRNRRALEMGQAPRERPPGAYL